MKTLTHLSIGIFMGLFFFYSCTDESNKGDLETTKEIVSFKFEKSLNEEYLNEDIISEITDYTISLKVPENIDISNLIATFTHTGKDVYIENIEQISGITANNFNDDLSYVVYAYDGSFAEYKIAWEKLEIISNLLLSFSFETSFNTDLWFDSQFDITESEITGKVISESPWLIASFVIKDALLYVDNIEQISGKTTNDFSNPVHYILKTTRGNELEFIVTVQFDSKIPHIYIETENKEPITSKSEYLNGIVTIDGKGRYEDYTGITRVRGRGNSTWAMPKKPYRLKLDNNAELLGLGREKDWVLLANYIDPTLMLNGVAMKIGQLLELPFTNHIIPVDVTVNGEYQGNYMFTEQVELSKTRVNIDEEEGVLLELDTNFDEDFQFMSTYFNLPVMIKDPDITSEEHFRKIQDEFHDFEAAVAADDFPDNNYKDFIDIESLVSYFIVFNFTHNMEINHPKSVYIHKDKGSKYVMGPIWDFDWTHGYAIDLFHFNRFNYPLFDRSWGLSGTPFFEKFLTDPEFVDLYKRKWSNFKLMLPGLLQYVEEYAELIDESQKMNYNIWPNDKNFYEEVEKLKEWIFQRPIYIDDYLNGL